MDVKYQLDNLRHDISIEETEETWDKISRALKSFMEIGESGAYESSPTEVVNALRNVHRPITSAMNSERTRLSGTALDLMNSVASGLGRDFDQLMPIFMPALLAICGRTNKVVITRAKATIMTIIESAQLASVLPYFVQNLKDKSATLRLILAEGTLACINSCNPPDLEKDARARDIEAVIRGTARDANPDVRKVSRRIFESYKILLPSRVESFTAPLSPTMKKYLDIKSTTVISNSKSTSNLRELKLKPSMSTSATTTAVDKVKGHSRTASSSSNVNSTTATQSRNLVATLTRVSRKEAAVAGPKPAPIRPTQTSRTASEAPMSNPIIAPADRPGPSRTVSVPEVKRPLPPLRAVSRPVAGPGVSTTSGTARRLPLMNESKPSAPSSSSGPRRVPMPPPPLPPAPKKGPEAAPKRSASRIDNSSSTTSVSKVPTAIQPPASKKNPTVQPIPPKKPAAVQAATSKSSAAPTAPPRERPISTKPPIPKFKPSSNPTASTSATSALASTSIKPLAVDKAKPRWGGRPDAASKPVAINSKPAEKNIVKKPSSLAVKSGPKTSGLKRSITPAMIALPSSPTPEQGKTADAQTSSKASEVVSEDSSTPLSADPEAIQPSLEISTPAEDTIGTSRKETPTPASVSPVESRLPTPTNETPTRPTIVDQPPAQLLSEPRNSPDNLPHTPQANMLLNPAAGATAMAAKTPISALLSSIERGFLYSPTTPLSPADSYLPGPNGTISYNHETHAPRVDGPMQPFNYALHANSHGMNGGLFGHDGSKLICGDIGVVNVTEHDKLYGGQSGLPQLEDSGRPAFSELNQ
ncbi:clasp N terminal-domain-containing protein [Crepidotus variabilis]|uniref:Clasp N terminal-domain-containing protein n=1 Tax=Crepidotus variabilis TaxID=179855 RepID=A0A9P6EQF0_9AGAR|nr:clasp N terminal-domain-containing protein [Crepidotus variabilis]